jgi:squalene synthase HpnC
MVRSHYENFPVASCLLPRAMRPHVAAVYAFARVADDVADEGVGPAVDRQARLAAWRAQLHGAAAGRVVPSAPPTRDELIFLALGNTIRTRNLPVALFDDLLSAFGQDTMTKRYASWSDVLDYCRRSANPVGRLVLRIAGYRDEQLDRSSDALCTALQLTNFWQDFGRDWRVGRLYVPREVAAACGADEKDLTEDRMTAAWSAAIQRAVDFTRALFDEGTRVCDEVRGRLRFELRLTWLGGSRMLTRVERHRSRLLAYRPTLRARDVPILLGEAMIWAMTGPPRRARRACEGAERGAGSPRATEPGSGAEPR